MSFSKLNFDEQEILEYQKWVRIIVNRLCKAKSLPERYKPDLFSTGILALFEAKTRYLTSSEVPFKAFAYLRVRGAMIDYLRKNGELKHSILISDEQEQILSQIQCQNEWPDQIAERNNLLMHTSKLSPLQKKILKAIYLDDESFATISKRLKKSRSWVCRQHQSILIELAKQAA